ncbi:MAG: 4-alpha-glucanotransferase [Thermomicrobiaceae bacterium]
MYQRSSGLLCHVTSLPGAHGVGDLGKCAFEFVDLLARADQHLWQVLPLGPAGAGDSPYDSRSSFAGNPLMISISRLVESGLLRVSDVPETAGFPDDRVEFKRVERWKGRRLRRAFDNFQSGKAPSLQSSYEEFETAAGEWLDDFALYQALREKHDGSPWYTWPPELRRPGTDVVSRARSTLTSEIAFHKFVQFLFQLQWNELKPYANARGISIMGDIPIYVALDSADVWANQDQFVLDDAGQPTVQAGVPPDLFTSDGQLWGNPVYDWDRMAQDDYRWWERRIRRVFELTDIVRIDHFRGFAAGWQVPAGEKTARNGTWVTGPGRDFFDRLEERLGRLPIVVEDLGVITPDVEALRDGLGYPGMKVLQFAFGDGPDNPYLPHNIIPNSMVYTGTHDNETSAGWFSGLPTPEQRHVQKYLRANRKSIHLDMIRAAWSSVAVLACTPVQDLLGLGNEARMNVPGVATRNWGWRLQDLERLRRRSHFLQSITELYGRNHAPLEFREEQR